MKKFILMTLAVLLAVSPAMSQQKDWTPTGVWPFVNKNFRPATVVTGFINLKKTVVPCNIHVGNQTLWYAQNDTMMEAYPGTVLRIEFKDDVYIPVNGNTFGKVVRDDSINGKPAKVVKVWEVDNRELERRGRDVRNMTSSLLQSGGLLSSLTSQLADVNGGTKLEEEPLPMKNTFYFIFNGEIFEAKERNILKYIDPKRRKEYRAFTRSAEIISSNESSIVKIWENFFLR